MNIDRVFIKNDTDGTRNLIYLTLRGDKYIDMYTNKKYEKTSIDQSQIYSFKEVIQKQILKLSKGNIKKCFQEDENKLIDMNQIFVGDLKQITRILSRKYNNKGYVTTQFQSELLEKNILFQSDFLEDINLLTGDKYNSLNIVPDEGDICIPKEYIRPAALTLGINKSKVKKKELLKKYSEWRCNNE